jgi:hypothetical protein
MSPANSAVLALVGPVLRSRARPECRLSGSARVTFGRLYQQDAVTAGQFMGAGTVGWEPKTHPRSIENVDVSARYP